MQEQWSRATHGAVAERRNDSGSQPLPLSLVGGGPGAISEERFPEFRGEAKISGALTCIHLQCYNTNAGI